MSGLSFILMLLFAHGSSPSVALSQSELTGQLTQYNYFSNSPATLATFCRKEDCISAYTGHTSFSQREPVTAQSLTSIGSNSKLITAILTLLMVDRGQLSLDDKLTEFFPEYTLWQGVTIRDLLQHSSGVPPYLFSSGGTRRLILSVFNWRTRIWRPEELAGIVARQPLIFTPGSRVEYNNTNYILLGMILEKRTRQPLAELLERELFTPLGMTQSYLTAGPEQAVRRMSGYVPLDLPSPDWLFNLIAYKVEKTSDYLETTRIFDDSFTWAAGGMLSTTDDLTKLLRGLYGGKILSDKLVGEMMEFRSGTVLGFPFLYGLGLMRSPTKHGDLYGHGGLTPGYQTITNYLPEKEITLSLVQNLGPSQLYSIYDDLLDVLVNEEPYREFVPAPELDPEILQDRSMHLRVYGRVVSEAAPPSIFSKSWGYSRLRRLRDEATYQVFEARTFERATEPLLSIEGFTSRNPFLSGNSPETRKSFVVVEIDPVHGQSPLGETVSGAGADGTIMAYRGIETLDAAGAKVRCIYEVLDDTREYVIQVDVGDSLRVAEGQVYKFVGHIPMRSVSQADLPLQLQTMEVCQR